MWKLTQIADLRPTSDFGCRSFAFRAAVSTFALHYALEAIR